VTVTCQVTVTCLHRLCMIVGARPEILPLLDNLPGLEALSQAVGGEAWIVGCIWLYNFAIQFL